MRDRARTRARARKKEKPPLLYLHGYLHYVHFSSGLLSLFRTRARARVRARSLLKISLQMNNSWTSRNLFVRISPRIFLPSLLRISLPLPFER